MQPTQVQPAYWGLNCAHGTAEHHACRCSDEAAYTTRNSDRQLSSKCCISLAALKQLPMQQPATSKQPAGDLAKRCHSRHNPFAVHSVLCSVSKPPSLQKTHSHGCGIMCVGYRPCRPSCSHCSDNIAITHANQAEPKPWLGSTMQPTMQSNKQSVTHLLFVLSHAYKRAPWCATSRTSR